ncbi:MAG: TetR/AcrR family transcriptional regulator C-terminal domain-containing protein [Acidimicrobiales bacterium]
MPAGPHNEETTAPRDGSQGAPRTEPTRPARVALSRRVIAERALAITDEHGLEGLSMRKLGAELGVEAMSLYHYVDSKSDLLDAMLDLLYSEISLPADIPEDDWEQLVRASLRAYCEVLLNHRASVELFANRTGKSATSLTILAWAYDRFLALGLSPSDAMTVFHLAVSFVLGHAASFQGALAPGSTDPPPIDPADLTPEIEVFVAERPHMTAELAFEESLTTLIAGLRARFDLP